MERELYVRRARRDGRSVALLRALERGDGCVVEAVVHPAGEEDAALHPGPWTFPDVRSATAFVTDAVESLMYLGCEIHAE